MGFQISGPSRGGVCALKWECHSLVNGAVTSELHSFLGSPSVACVPGVVDSAFWEV